MRIDHDLVIMGTADHDAMIGEKRGFDFADAAQRCEAHRDAKRSALRECVATLSQLMDRCTRRVTRHQRA
jgi:hypothetical protein